jgi:hypothetical protein
LRREKLSGENRVDLPKSGDEKVEEVDDEIACRPGSRRATSPLKSEFARPVSRIGQKRKRAPAWNCRGSPSPLLMVPSNTRNVPAVDGSLKLS